MQLIQRMARRLLEVPRMRCLAILPLLVSAGCLYLGDLNHAPSCTVTPSVTSAFKGKDIHFAVVASDPDRGDRLTRTHEIATADGQQLTPCDVNVSDVGELDYSVSFNRTGTFRVTTIVKDELGAAAPTNIVMVSILNAPPVFDSTSMIGTTEAPGTCGFTVTNPIFISFTGNVVDADEGSGGCGMYESLSYAWTLKPPPGSTAAAITYATNGHCAPRPSGAVLSLLASSTDQVCVWPDYGPALASTDYGITLTVSDGGDTADSISTSVGVTGDALPCITGLSPGAGSYVIDPQNPAPFDTLSVSAVTDDLDSLGTLTFYWSLWRESDPVWRDIAIHDTHYSPDYSIFGVGEHVRIRVEAVDRTGKRAKDSCSDPSVDSCEVRSCNSSPCYQWKTWNLELR
jgi:hypothetical protein